MSHFVIDIETLGLRTDAVIESIGVVMVDDRLVVCDSAAWYVDTMQDSRTVDRETVAWRGQHAPLSIGIFRCQLDVALRQLWQWFVAHEFGENDLVWSWHNFDFRLLEHAYEQVGMKPAWGYRQCMDIPSAVFGATGALPGKLVCPHVAVEDARIEAGVLIEMLREKR